MSVSGRYAPNRSAIPDQLSVVRILMPYLSLIRVFHNTSVPRGTLKSALLSSMKITLGLAENQHEEITSIGYCVCTNYFCYEQ